MEGGAGVARRCTRSRASRRMTVGVASRPRKAALGLGASCFTGANEPVQSVVKPFPFFSLRSLLKPEHESSFCRSTYLIRTNPLHRCASPSLFPSSSSSLPALFSCPCPVSIVEIPLSIYPEQSSLSFSRPFFVTPLPPPSSPLIILLYKRMKPFKQRSRSFCGGCKAKTKGGSARAVTLFTGGVLTPHRLALRFVAPSLPSCFWSCKTSTHPQAPLSLKLESCSSDSSLHSPVFSFEPVALSPSFRPACHFPALRSNPPDAICCPPKSFPTVSSLLLAIEYAHWTLAGQRLNHGRRDVRLLLLLASGVGGRGGEARSFDRRTDDPHPFLPSLCQSKSLVRDSCFPSVMIDQRLTLFMLASCRTDYAEKMTSGSSSL